MKDIHDEIILNRISATNQRDATVVTCYAATKSKACRITYLLSVLPILNKPDKIPTVKLHIIIMKESNQYNK